MGRRVPVSRLSSPPPPPRVPQSPRRALFSRPFPISSLSSPRPLLALCWAIFVFSSLMLPSSVVGRQRGTGFDRCFYAQVTVPDLHPRELVLEQPPRPFFSTRLTSFVIFPASTPKGRNGAVAFPLWRDRGFLRFFVRTRFPFPTRRIDEIRRPVSAKDRVERVTNL